MLVTDLYLWFKKWNVDLERRSTRWSKQLIIFLFKTIMENMSLTV